MLGWNIRVYRKLDDRMKPAVLNSPQGPRIAVWQAGMSGLNWIMELEKEGKAMLLGGNGYPALYTAQAEHLIPVIIAGPPQVQSPWISERTDILLDGWEGKTVIDHTAAENCPPNEWLIVEAWDES